MTAPNSHETWHELPRSEESAPPPPGGPTAEQAESVAAWLRWHAVELVGVGVPLALSLLISVWFVILAAPAAALWAVHETRNTRQRALPGADRGALTSSGTTTGEEAGQ